MKPTIPGPLKVPPVGFPSRGMEGELEQTVSGRAEKFTVRLHA